MQLSYFKVPGSYSSKSLGYKVEILDHPKNQQECVFSTTLLTVRLAETPLNDNIFA
jgi:hypothetical protein